MRMWFGAFVLSLAGCGGEWSVTGQLDVDLDLDDDGVVAALDCDDEDAAVNPEAVEACNGVDDDCDGVIDDGVGTTWYADADADGYGDVNVPTVACDQPAGTVADATDCDDAVAAVHPDAAEEDCADPTDYNCDGSVAYEDADADGFAACEDCDDADATRSPAAQETCDDEDDDCDDEIDEDSAVDASPWYPDGDGDGYGDGDAVISCDPPEGHVALDGDCDDAAEAFHPGADEADCEDPNDYNCDGSVGYDDGDGDGYPACAECDDGTSWINPGATEACNAVDDDCDTTIDEDDAVDASTWYVDADSDSYGGTATTIACDAPTGYVATSTDCDDTDGTDHPGATESCDGDDDDCDGDVDESGATGESTWYADGDGDGYGGDSAATACDAPAGYVADTTDCDDGDEDVSPAAPESCNDVDDDCDGSVDEAGAAGEGTWYADADGDGYGGDSASTACDAPPGYVANTTDCDDMAAAVHPGATESCDDVDDDCDGSVDESGATGETTWYRDADSDGHGGTSTLAACDAPTGYVATSTDCDDADAAEHPGATETCDDDDDDCDGSIDESGATGETTWYRDADSDGYGGASTSVSCDRPTGYVATSTDCDDGDGAEHPGATETCDGDDDDCDGTADEAGASGATTWYWDGDLDGYGLTSTSTTACTAPSGYVEDGGDCDDADTARSPGESESCNAIDDDCDGDIDDGGGTCPCAVEEYGGSVYQFCTTTADWTSAQAACNADGYDLASLTTSAENTFVVDAAMSRSVAQWWVGFNDRAVEETWAWESGETFSWSNWHSGEPNDTGSGEDCGQIGRWSTSGTTDYSWNDEDCGNTYAYVCEG